jgi:hypothetical protein
MLPPIISPEVSANAGTKRKAPDVDYSESPCCNSPVAKKKEKQMSCIRRRLKKKPKKQKLHTNF